MENKLTPELIEKARQAKSAEELSALAKENGIELSEDETKAYFEQLNKSGELSDDELDSVAGGGCYKKDGRLVVTCYYYCKHFVCRGCKKNYVPKKALDTHKCPACFGDSIFSYCDNCTYQSGMSCTHPENYKR
ncbi:MAG: Nif11-like leader peptide family RiPP precursor [Prevotella sp.]|nr:Nif11-like leader peptide family RiPP precursor [Prevotella sp.]